MAIEIKAPTYPESVQEGTLATWHKNVGDSVTRDELLVDIETDKVVLEVVAPVTGVLTKVLKAEGDIILSNEIIATIDEVAASRPQRPRRCSKSRPMFRWQIHWLIQRLKNAPMSWVLISQRSQALERVAESPKKMWSILRHHHPPWQ